MLSSRDQLVWDDWIADLRRSIDYGENCYANMMFDIHHARIPSDLYKSLQKKIIRQWRVHKLHKAHHVLDRTCSSKRQKGSFYCKGPSVTLRRSCSRVVDFDVLRDKCLLSFHLAPVGFTAIYNGTVEENDLSLLANSGLVGLLRPDATIRGGKPLAWVTPSDDLDSVRNSSSGSPYEADYVRDKLGLRYTSSVFLIEIKYPRDHPVLDRLVAPTFLDGCPNYVYRSARTSDGWGRAVDLGTDEYTDGLPEAIHPTIDFTLDFTLSYIGRLKTSLKSIDWIKLNSTIHNGTI